MQVAWARCLVGVDDARDPAENAPMVEADLHEPAGLAERLMRTTQDITRALIGAQAGHLLMLHAGAVSHPQTGASVVYVAPGGTGKTTLSRLLGQRLGYLTDETVGITRSGNILPYPKPLSVRRPIESWIKDEVSPDDLGLQAASKTSHVTRIVLLMRDREAGSVEIEELSVMDAVFAVVEETSSLARLERPLHRLAELLETTGPTLRVHYGEATDIEDQLMALVGEL